jgi:para-aminobenzoate synthetase / 4-amino-4-deoxychorismate lyase
MPSFDKKNQVILHDLATSQWLLFNSPHQIVTAGKIDEVVPALERVESFINENGWHAAGFISYEAAKAFDTALCTHTENFPLLWFGLYTAPELIELPRPDFQAYNLSSPIPSIKINEYREAISRIKEYIRSGDTYQVNYTLQLRADFSGDPWHLFLAMVHAQGSGYAAWVDMGRIAICSSSPELFFRLEGDRLVCKPMKGTVRRGRTLAEDDSYADWLQSSEKNRAENLMIVDMIRNDLGRVSDPGSVQTTKLFEVERRPTLWQMTSTVCARSNASLKEIMKSLFPCASITGAPKIRTTQIIAELEPIPRGIYTGCIGYMSPGRIAQFNVAIRTAVVDRLANTAEYGAGGGIVWDSEGDDEYTEALLKTRVLEAKQPEFSLLETILWNPEDSFFILDDHIQRLKDSAAYFSCPIDVRRIYALLQERMVEFSGKRQKIRLLLSANGSVHIENIPLDPDGTKRPVRLRLSRKAVDPSDIFLYHKTTNRTTYESALREFPDFDDVLLTNNRGEVTESCTSNVVVELDGKLLTPSVDSGLLPGVFRASLIKEGRISECTIKIADLDYCTRIYLINSVRKWREAVLFL